MSAVLRRKIVCSSTSIVARTRSFIFADHSMPVSMTPFCVVRRGRAAEVLPSGVAMGRFALLVALALAWAIFTSLTITASQACASGDGAARLVSASVLGDPGARVTIRNTESNFGEHCNFGEPGSAHHGCCTGGCCSTCSLALNGAIPPSCGLSKARIDFFFLEERPTPVDRRPDLRPPIPFA
jgi:hypothetical protein